jgi:hypothetical protein
MEARASDPAVQQFGMIAGVADAGQVNGLGTLNICSERSVAGPQARTAAQPDGLGFYAYLPMLQTC